MTKTKSMVTWTAARAGAAARSRVAIVGYRPTVAGYRGGGAGSRNGRQQEQDRPGSMGRTREEEWSGREAARGRWGTAAERRRADAAAAGRTPVRWRAGIPIRRGGTAGGSSLPCREQAMRWMRCDGGAWSRRSDRNKGSGDRKARLARGRGRRSGRCRTPRVEVRWQDRAAEGNGQRKTGGRRYERGGASGPRPGRVGSGLESYEPTCEPPDEAHGRGAARGGYPESESGDEDEKLAAGVGECAEDGGETRSTDAAKAARQGRACGRQVARADGRRRRRRSRARGGTGAAERQSHRRQEAQG